MRHAVSKKSDAADMAEQAEVFHYASHQSQYVATLSVDLTVAPEN